MMFSTRSFVFILLPLFVAGAPPNWHRRSPVLRSLDVFPQMNGPTMMISESQVMASRRGFEENRASKPKAQIKRRSPGQSPQPAPDEQAGLIPLAGTLPGRTKYGAQMTLMKGEDEHKDWPTTSTPGAHHDIAPPSKQKGPSFKVKGSPPRRGPRKNTRWVNSEVGADNSFDYAKGRKEDTPRRRRQGPGKPAGKPASARPVHNKQTSQAMSLDEPQPAPGHNKQAESPPGLPLNEDEMHGRDPAFWLSDHIHSGSRPHN